MTATRTRKGKPRWLTDPLTASVWLVRPDGLRVAELYHAAGRWRASVAPPEGDPQWACWPLLDDSSPHLDVMQGLARDVADERGLLR